LVNVSYKTIQNKELKNVQQLKKFQILASDFSRNIWLQKVILFMLATSFSYDLTYLRILRTSLPCFMIRSNLLRY